MVGGGQAGVQGFNETCKLHVWYVVDFIFIHFCFVRVSQAVSRPFPEATGLPTYEFKQFRAVPAAPQMLVHPALLLHRPVAHRMRAP